MQWLLPELHEWFDCVQFYYLQFNTIRHAAFAVVPLSSLSCFFNLHSCRTYATHGVGKERGLDHYAIDSTQLKVEMFSDSDPPFCFGSPFSTWERFPDPPFHFESPFFYVRAIPGSPFSFRVSLFLRESDSRIPLFRIPLFSTRIPHVRAIPESPIPESRIPHRRVRAISTPLHNFYSYAC